MSCYDPLGSLLDGHGAGEALGNGYDLWNWWDQPEAETAQYGTSPEYAILKHHQPPHQGTSQSSNVSNADAERAARIRESKRNSWLKKETERKENEKRLAEVTKENGVLLEVNARLEKEGGEAKVKQKSVEQELSYCKEEVSRLNNKLKRQTMQRRKLRDIKLTRTVKRIRVDMVKINEGQEALERIRAGQKEVREKFEEISKETAKLKEETDIISKQSAANQVRLDLMFQIVKARSENDFPKDAALTRIPRALINGEAEECKHNMS